MQKKSERVQIACVLAVHEKKTYERSAKDLGMPLSEFFRRCVRVGMPVLMSANYPGVPRQEENAKAD